MTDEHIEPDQATAIPRPVQNTPQEDRMIAILRNAIAWCFYGDDTREVIELPQEDIDRCQAVAERCVADLQEDKLQRQKESNLVSHARYELELIGEEPATIDWYCNTVLAFAEYGHSGGSSSVAVPILHKLLQYQHLNELTTNPNEWIQQDEKLWQNRRNGEAFSLDGGKTYYLLSESSGKRVKWHKSKETKDEGAS
jgi:hypothetical protein